MKPLKMDFSHLEKNPNYKPEEETPETPEVPETPETPEKPEVETPDVPEKPDAPKGDDNKPAPNDAESSLKPETPEVPEKKPEEPQKPVFSEELMFKTLSEKLGKEVNSFDDLKQKEVEIPEIDPRVKALDEWSKKTGRPMEDYFKYQKNYDEVDDLTIARETLQLEYPTLTPSEIELEMEQFLQSDDDLESDLAKKKLALKKYATKGRDILNKMKADLGEAPSNVMTPEVQKMVDFAKKAQEQFQANAVNAEEYVKGISQASNKLEKIVMNLAEGVEIDFSIPEEERKALPDFIDSMPHWYNEDGSWNHESVAKDGAIIRNYEKMLQLAYEQGKNSGKDELLKESKNTTLDTQGSPKSEQGTGTKRPKYEGFDPDSLGKGISFKRR